jgi:hypothetical protein
MFVCCRVCLAVSMMWHSLQMAVVWWGRGATSGCWSGTPQQGRWGRHRSTAFVRHLVC